MVQHQIEKWLQAQTVNDVMGNKSVFRTNDRYACWRKKGHCTQETLFFKKKKDSLSKKKNFVYAFKGTSLLYTFLIYSLQSGATVYSVDIFLISTLGCCALNNKVNLYNDNSILLCFLYSMLERVVHLSLRRSFYLWISCIVPFVSEN